jgi:hypothetical protein
MSGLARAPAKRFVYPTFLSAYAAVVDVRTTRGVTRALLFPKAILRAEFEAAAPMRDAMKIKRERLQGKESCQAAAIKTGVEPTRLSR